MSVSRDRIRQTVQRDDAYPIRAKKSGEGGGEGRESSRMPYVSALGAAGGCERAKNTDREEKRPGRM